MPSISVIIPSYNREHLLPETLQSLLPQTMPDWQAIVVDDHSIDSSYEIAESFAKRDARIRCERRLGENRGANVCRNQGLRAASAPYIVFLDSDDLLLPDALERRLRAVQAEPDFDFQVFMTGLFVRQPGDSKLLWNRYTDRDDLQRFLGMDLVWHTSGPIWKRSVLERLGGWDESLPSFQDWDIHVRALIAKLKYRKHATVDCLYRRPQWETSQISSKSVSDPEHLKSHRRIFRRALEMLLAGPPDLRTRRGQVAALYWWLAERWFQIGNVATGLDVWKEARDIGICSRFHHLLGAQALRHLDGRSGRYLLVFLERAFKSVFAGLGSPHFHSAATDVRN